MSVKLLTEHYLEFLSLKAGCKGSSESTLVKMPQCWKSHVVAQLYLYVDLWDNVFKISLLIFISNEDELYVNVEYYRTGDEVQSN